MLRFTQKWKTVGHVWQKPFTQYHTMVHYTDQFLHYWLLTVFVYIVEILNVDNTDNDDKMNIFITIIVIIVIMIIFVNVVVVVGMRTMMMMIMMIMMTMKTTLIMIITLLSLSSWLNPTPNDQHMWPHYCDVIMSAVASQITGVTIVYSTVCSGADQRKHQSSASLAFVRGIHRWTVNSPHKGPITRKMFPFDDVIMIPHNLIYEGGRTTHPRNPIYQSAYPDKLNISSPEVFMALKTEVCIVACRLSVMK